MQTHARKTARTVRKPVVQPRTENSIEYKGDTIYWQVSPCSWMYPFYGCQVQLSLSPNPKNSASIFINDKAAAGFDYHKLCEYGSAMVRLWLGDENVAALKHRAERSVVEEATLAAALEELLAEQQALPAEQDASYAAEGYTHRIDTWVHPAEGNDYQRTTYTRGEPTKEVIDQILGDSVIKTDYSVTKL